MARVVSCDGHIWILAPYPKLGLALDAPTILFTNAPLPNRHIIHGSRCNLRLSSVFCRIFSKGEHTLVCNEAEFQAIRLRCHHFLRCSSLFEVSILTKDILDTESAVHQILIFSHNLRTMLKFSRPICIQRHRLLRDSKRCTTSNRL